MVYYKVTVHTGDYEHADTLNDVFITLVGRYKQSERTMLQTNNQTPAFVKGEVSSFTVICPESLGDLIMIKLDKQPHDIYPEDEWFLDQVEVKSEEDDTYTFPVYCWITDSEEHCFSEGTACTGQKVLYRQEVQVLSFSSMAKVPRLSLSLGSWWNTASKDAKTKYRWRVYKEKLPHCIDAVNPSDLPSEVRFSYCKTIEFNYTALSGLLELKLKGLADCPKSWTNLEDISRILFCKYTDISSYAQKHWMEDAFFAHQFLNGINPMMIQRCTALPENFPVTDDMVCLQQSNLADEMKKGNIFLCDYKNLDGLQANTINGKQQYLTAPLVLLHKRPNDKLMPVAIQLKQTPGNDNPIFVPSDPTYDWLLAKTFVRSADFSEHELNFHLLRTHLLAEVFAVSLLRNFSKKHPLYKLLMPHTRYTLHINILARQLLISADGVFTKFTASGGEAMTTILERSLSSLTYRSLCIRDNIADRGLESLPHFYYREDGFRLWDIIYRFVQGILECYYNNDDEVLNDLELQGWIGEIFEHGFLSQESTGIPQKFNTVEETVKFVTMVMFTCSAQHSAVNSGQYDYGAWMPNFPTSLQHPPPEKKGSADEGTLLQTLPAVNTTANGIATMWLLSKPPIDRVPLGDYREKYFCEEIPKLLIEVFQKELYILSERIKKRNATLEIQYRYLDPHLCENSVAL